MGSVDVQKNFNSIPMLGVVLEPVSTDPPSLIEGRIWTRTDFDTLKVFLGSTAKTVVTTDTLPTGLPPTGAAGGDLTNNYPNPNVTVNAITEAKMARSVIQTGLNSGTAATTDSALRKLGFTTHDSMPGTARLDQIAAPTASVSMNSQKITGLLDGTSAQDAVTKAQLDGAIQGLDAKLSCKWSTTASLGLGAGSGGSSVASQTVLNTALTSGMTGGVDSSTIIVNDRILAKNEASAARNGIWVVTAVSVGTSITVQRAEDMNATSEVQGAFTFAEDTGTGWVSSFSGGTNFGTASIVWTQFSSAGSYTAGAGLGLSGLDFFVNVDGASLEIATDILRVKALGILSTMLADNSIDLAGSKVTGVVPVYRGGTNGTTSAEARANLGVPGAYLGSSPAMGTAGTWYTVTHSLGVRAKAVSFKVSDASVELDWRDKGGDLLNSIEIKHDITAGRAASYYTVSVMG